MRVLMFGWEFPPQLSGGLGTACAGLVRALSRHGVEVTLIVPRWEPDATGAAAAGVTPRAASEVPLPPRPESPDLQADDLDFAPTTLRFLYVDSPLRPYLSPERYREEIQASSPDTAPAPAPPPDTAPAPAPPPDTVPAPAPDAGGYGPDLFQEVARYALVGRELGRQGGFDVIHCHEWMTFLAGVEARHTSGSPLVMHVHATEVERSGYNPDPEIYRLERAGLEVADHVIAVSQRTRTLLIEQYGLAPERISVVYNAADLVPLPPPLAVTPPPEPVAVAAIVPPPAAPPEPPLPPPAPAVPAPAALPAPVVPALPVAVPVSESRPERQLPSGERMVLFVGRFTLQKGPGYFVAAAARAHQVLAEMGIGVRFVMAGTGDLLPEIIGQVRGLGMLPHFHFTGFVRGPELGRLFAQCSLYVLPSVAEPFGIAPLEAVQAGIPVIVSRQAGVAELLREAIQVDFWNVGELASEIVRALSDEAHRRARLAAMQAELAGRDWAQAAHEVEEVYARLQFDSPAARKGESP